MKKLFDDSYTKYLKFMGLHLDYWEDEGSGRRREQCEGFVDIFDDIKFPFDKLHVVETGTSYGRADGIFGLILGFATEQLGGMMYSVDIDQEKLDKSQELFSQQTPTLDYRLFNEDSVSFLENLSIIPNLVHLDSWDLDLKNPFPSALHGWREFMAIESKMESGSIILIDDNFLKGTFVQWNYSNGDSERIDIEYPIIGKGALVYHYVIDGRSDWNLIGKHYKAGSNIKIILQKK